jgi:hypothetical protein
VKARGANAPNASLISVPINFPDGSYGVQLRSLVEPTRIFDRLDLEFSPLASPMPEQLRGIQNVPLQEDLRAMIQACFEPERLALNAFNLSLRREEGGFDQDIANTMIARYASNAAGNPVESRVICTTPAH